ncbi:hypothetical protein HK101_002127 [Irineochytrium annulatum]|nr:hypothetical protein HK101_002127 [Irineochytrium annulatum]
MVPTVAPPVVPSPSSLATIPPLAGAVPPTTVEQTALPATTTTSSFGSWNMATQTGPFYTYTANAVPDSTSTNLSLSNPLYAVLLILALIIVAILFIAILVRRYRRRKEDLRPVGPRTQPLRPPAPASQVNLTPGGSLFRDTASSRGSISSLAASDISFALGKSGAAASAAKEARASELASRLRAADVTGGMILPTHSAYSPWEDGSGQGHVVIQRTQSSSSLKSLARNQPPVGSLRSQSSFGSLRNQLSAMHNQTSSASFNPHPAHASVLIDGTGSAMPPPTSASGYSPYPTLSAHPADDAIHYNNPYPNPLEPTDLETLQQISMILAPTPLLYHRAPPQIAPSSLQVLLTPQPALARGARYSLTTPARDSRHPATLRHAASSSALGVAHWSHKPTTASPMWSPPTSPTSQRAPAFSRDVITATPQPSRQNSKPLPFVTPTASAASSRRGFVAQNPPAPQSQHPPPGWLAHPSARNGSVSGDSSSSSGGGATESEGSTAVVEAEEGAHGAGDGRWGLKVVEGTEGWGLVDEVMGWFSAEEKTAQDEAAGKEEEGLAKGRDLKDRQSGGWDMFISETLGRFI